MSSDEIRAFWNDGARAERERVMLRISQGTKGASPDIRNVNRMNPGFYFNPLPDNSSGSKIRPFQCSKDESGRPTAMEIVMANQQRGSGYSGGVKNYQYARSVLDRRARDVANLDLEAQGLPAMAEPIAEMSVVDSKNLELNNLLQNIQQQVETGSQSQITLNDLKGIPRLLIGLTPTYTPQEAVELIQYIDDDVLAVIRQENDDTRLASINRRLDNFFTAIRGFLGEMVGFLGLDEMTKRNASLTLGKKYFGKRLAEADVAPAPIAPVPVAEEEEGDEDESQPPPSTAPSRRSTVPSSVEEEEEEEEAPAPRQPAGNDNLRRAFRENDTATLEAFVRRNFPRLTADKYFKSRTTLANVIRDKAGINIR